MNFLRDSDKDDDYIFTYYTKSEVVLHKSTIINLQLQGWVIEDCKSDKRFYDDLIRLKIKRKDYLRNITIYKTDATTESTNESTN